MRIEIFKTNITNCEQAKCLVEEIHKTFPFYHANFDLSDCDRVLRVVSSTGSIELNHFMEWLKNCGCNAEVLPDN